MPSPFGNGSFGADLYSAGRVQALVAPAATSSALLQGGVAEAYVRVFGRVAMMATSSATTEGRLLWAKIAVPSCDVWTSLVSNACLETLG
jgi:hypothetical protein